MPCRVEVRQMESRTDHVLSVVVMVAWRLVGLVGSFHAQRWRLPILVVRLIEREVRRKGDVDMREGVTDVVGLRLMTLFGGWDVGCT